MNNTKINNSKIIFISLFILSGLMFLLPLVTSAITLVTPQDSGNHSSTIDLNCTQALADVTNALNATIYYNSSGGPADTTATKLTTISNSSADDLEFFSSGVSISSLSGASFNVSCIIGNGTLTKQDSSKLVTFDSVVPSCTSGDTLRSRNLVELGGTNKLTCTCTDTIDANPTVTRTITKPGATLVSVTSSPYTSGLSDLNKVGIYNFECKGVDYSTNSRSNNATFRVDSADDAVNNDDVITTTQITSSSNNLILISSAVLILIVIATVVIVWSVKK